LDSSRGMGSEDDFLNSLKDWADVLILTATSILNETTETILEHAGPRLKTIILGPSTPMVPAAFEHLPIHMLAGTVPLQRENIFKAVRQGAGTPVIHKYSKKSYYIVPA
jgi:uncharacterized protein